jgi:hypothetical protein
MDLTWQGQDARRLTLNAFGALRLQSDETRSNLYAAQQWVKSVEVSQQHLAISAQENVHLRPYLTELCQAICAQWSKASFARSKANTMDPEVARNQYYNDHYANDSKNVHSAALTVNNDNGARCVRTPCVSPPLSRWRHSVIAGLVRRKPGHYKSVLSPTPVSPISASSEEQKEHQDDENELHIFLQNNGQDFPPRHVGVGLPITSFGFYLLASFPMQKKRCDPRPIIFARAPVQWAVRRHAPANACPSFCPIQNGYSGFVIRIAPAERAGQARWRRWQGRLSRARMFSDADLTTGL